MNGTANIEKIQRRTKLERDDMKRNWKQKRRRAKLNSIRNHRRAA